MKAVPFLLAITLMVAACSDENRGVNSPATEGPTLDILSPMDMQTVVVQTWSNSSGRWLLPASSLWAIVDVQAGEDTLTCRLRAKTGEWDWGTWYAIRYLSTGRQNIPYIYTGGSQFQPWGYPDFVPRSFCLRCLMPDSSVAYSDTVTVIVHYEDQ